ncbi:MAG: histidine kinase dimerization/phosphoacceptor domain -containing protein, partial [Pacificimonas sp.]
AQLKLRLKQQSLVADFGRFALETDDIDAVMTKASVLAAEGMNVEFAKVLRKQADGDLFLIEAGVGWKPGVVGVATIPGGLESPAGFAFQTGKPVISNHLHSEDRFRTPAVMLEHGVQRAINVLLGGTDDRYGVLETDSRSEGAFSDDDVNFLQSLANMLGVAIEKANDRARIVALNANLKAALDHRELMAREIDHRVKNSLAIVSGLLSMQSRASDSEELKSALAEASGRIATIGHVHGTLYEGESGSKVDFGAYLAKLTRELVAAHTDDDVDLSIDVVPVTMESGNAISLGLIAAELITNAVKHRCDRGGDCSLSIGCAVEDGTLALSVEDNGGGLPDGFDPATSMGLGMRIVTSLTRALHGDFAPETMAVGTRFVVRVPVAKLR